MTLAEPRITVTGGRRATTRYIPPKLALSVGMPSMPAPQSWQWSPLTSLARLESGHTPSRLHPEYWGGDIPWMGIRDAKARHGRAIYETLETTNEFGIENSSARILPQNTVCLSRTASVGYVVVMGRPMATSQDFVNWVCSKQLDHNFLKYLFIAEGDEILRFASGSVHSTIYFPEVKAFHICYPSLHEQRRIVGILDRAFAGIATAKTNVEKNLQNTRALFESRLNSVFIQCGEGWIHKVLTEAAQVFTDGDWIETKDQSTKGVRLVQTGNVGEGAFKDRAEKARYISEATFERLRCTEIFEGDCLISRLPDPIGRSCLLPNTGERMITAVDCTIVRFDPTQLTPAYFIYYSQSQDYLRSVNSMTTGTTRNRISRSNLGRIELPVAPISDQKHIVANLDVLSVETQRLESIFERKLAALDALKKSLLHRAFAGEL
jgi:type I restriction enzyme, S subunit